MARAQTAAAKIVVDKTTKTVRAFDQSGRLIAQFPATIGSGETPSPVGAFKIDAIAHNPTYNYDSDVLQEPGNKKFKLPPGPNSPVGIVWIDLSKDNVGIHGTAEPAHIGRTESHGCIRLTNWDAARLAQMVAKDVPVVFME